MAKIIDDETIENVCILAKLSLSEEAKEKAKQDMQKMLDYVEKLDELDIALLRQMEREILLDTVYDERRLSDAELKLLLKERSVRALGKIRRILDKDTADEDCFSRIEAIVKVYEAIGADGGARHDF